jgi:HPt (histidine-containing phosphotransfer) domain-containing protein
MRIRYLGRKPANDPSNLFSATTAAAVNSSSTGGADIKLTATSKPSSPVRIPSTSTTGESKTLSAAALARLSDKTQQQHNGEQFSTPDIDSSTKLAPASKHMEQLDLARAISNLELDDPMAIGRNGGRAFRTSPPSASSIFSVGSYGAPGSLLSESNRLDASSSMNSSAQEFKYPYSRTMRQSLFQMGGTTTTFDATQYAKTNPTQWSHPLPAHLLEENKAKRKVSKRKSFEYEDANLSGVVRGSNLQVGLIPNISSHAPTAGAGNSARRRSSTTRSSRSASVNDIPSSGGSDQSSVSSGNIVTPSTQQLDVVIPEGDPVNYALGVEQCGGREELFLNLLEKFALGCEKIVERIDSAYVNGNYEIMRREAHSLKGSSAYVAALRVSKSAFRVQLACERILENRKQPKNRQVIMVVAEEQELLTNTGLSPRMSGDDMIVKPKFQEDEMDESLKLALQETHTRLKKEYKLLKGYLKRNFVFRSMQTKDHHHHHHRSDKQNACIVM